MRTKVFLVAKHEFISTLKRRSAQFAIFGLPILSLLILTGINRLADSQRGEDSALSSFVSDANEKVLPVGLVDETGQLTQFSPPADTLFALYPDLDAAKTAYEADEISRYYQIPANFLTNGEIFQYADAVSLESFEDYTLYSLLAENFIGDEAPVTLVIAPLQQYEEIDLSATEA